MARIGLIQVDNDLNGGIQERQDAMIELGTRCLENGADLIFFPEAYQYVHDRDIMKDKANLQQIALAWQERCAALARRFHAYVVPWDYYVGEDGNVYNASYILDREGALVGRYCKCSITVGELQRGVVPGCSLPVFDLDFGKVGIMICFDNYFPEVAAGLANKGAQLLLYPLFGDTLKPQWELKLRTRAADHSLHIASCQLTRETDIVYTGMTDPEGNVIQKLDENNRFCVVDVDMGKTVWTNTLALPGRRENLREYLHKCRNYKAFGDLASEGSLPWEWDEIIEQK